MHIFSVSIDTIHLLASSKQLEFFAVGCTIFSEPVVGLLTSRLAFEAAVSLQECL